MTNTSLALSNGAECSGGCSFLEPWNAIHAESSTLLLEYLALSWFFRGCVSQVPSIKLSVDPSKLRCDCAFSVC